jgi:GTP:adenosylcobinamide-phosphate guanylyltransferase
LSLSALVLAGSRGPGDPLAVYAGVSHKALIDVAGTPMLERVVAALAAVDEISRIVVMIEIPEQLRESASLRAAAGKCELQIIPAADSPSSSVAAGLQQLGTPLLVTTADHALLQPEWLRYFLDHRPRDVDVCAALARSEAVLKALPETRRTWLRFREARYSGCNLFFFATPAAIGIARTWRAFEAERKQPLKMVRRLGWGVALRYVFGRLTLAAALQRLGKLSGAKLAVVEMPFGLAAVDVDKPSDLDLVRGLLAGSLLP